MADPKKPVDLSLPENYYGRRIAEQQRYEQQQAEQARLFERTSLDLITAPGYKIEETFKQLVRENQALAEKVFNMEAKWNGMEAYYSGRIHALDVLVRAQGITIKAQQDQIDELWEELRERADRSGER